MSQTTEALIVHCTPRTGSRTAELVDHVRGLLPNADELDLAAAPPDWLSTERVDAYTARNYRGESLSPNDTASLTRMDAMTQQLIDHPLLVLAFPIYNFSVPAQVKAWFDSVVQKGKTWAAGPEGFRGLLPDHCGLIVATSGGSYAGATASDEHATRLAKANLEFMGVTDTQSVIVDRIHASASQTDARLNAATSQIDAALRALAGSRHPKLDCSGRDG